MWMFQKDEMMQKIAYVNQPISSLVSASELTEKKFKEILTKHRQYKKQLCAKASSERRKWGIMIYL